MKFNFLATCALVIAASTATTSSIHGVESVSSDYRELIRVDCKGAVHFFKGTPLEADFDMTFLKAAMDAFRDRIKERAIARCPGITEEEINRRLTPSLDLVFNYLFGEDDRVYDEICEGKFNDGVLNLGAFTNLFTAGSCMSSYVSFDISNLFPSTCSKESWETDGTCFVKGKFSDVVGGLEINAAATSCGADSIWPFMSVHCQGSACTNYFKPCSDVNSATQCGDALKCTDFAAVIDGAVDIEKTIADAFTTAGLWHSSIPSSNVWTTIIKPAREFWGSYFTEAFVGANKNDYLKFCIPKAEYNGETYGNFFTMTSDILYYPVEQQCTYIGACQPPKTCGGYPFYEYGCNLGTGKRTVNTFNVSRLFQSTDEEEISCSALATFSFDSECSDNTKSPNNCLGKDITTRGNGKAYDCHQASNGLCGFHLLGDGFCDPACNNEDCKFDGGDCLGPAEIISPKSNFYQCDITGRQMISSSSSCIDSYQNSNCIQKEIEFEKRSALYCMGQYGPTNQDCCVCNQTTTYTAVPEYDLRSQIVEYPISCNVIFPWDGKIGSFSVISQKDVTTQFPVSTLTQGEAKLISLDCDGFVTFAFVTPFARAKATGMLATVKFAEQVILNLAKLRQQNQPGGIFVGSNGLFTKLGYQHFGVFTLAYPLWQFTSAIRHEARGSDFTTYEKTTPGTLIMRDWDPKKSTYVSSLVVAELPSTCTFSKYASDRTCMMQYSLPILTKIGMDLKFKAAAAACPNTHIPQISSSVSGKWVDPFPFLTPCLNDAGCPTSHECVNIFQHANTVNFTTTGKSLPDLEYDLFSPILFGKAGRDPNWGARSSAWSTEDAVYALRKLFGGFKSPNPFTPTPNYNFGEVRLCFPKNDPLLVPILKTGTPYDWGTANQGVVWYTTATESNPTFNLTMEKYSFNGLSALTTPPIGIVDHSTPPPTKSPTTLVDADAGAQATFNGLTAYVIASITLIFSIMFVVF